ncbi:crotonase/enoyl-CoA hydratase family protein [Halovulum dunhuangense]|uniref:Crotonase/enoyl-CoA hydratase family protein n=1 Tax=Halovulum dunhuangense TaxID=1505036 RepID=A0A849L5P5_9RHOB|nr:crotonase/enoyl-CoA hydratase family protein [Halovulum dunhuangense]NNU81451.1 crotonase/enoyl-CoA hydratase family protein [Halovulum dunhuangense]
MVWQQIRLETDARGVATLTLDRPERHNALSARMVAELAEAAALLGADPAVRAVVLTGAGASFCAGGDLEWMRAQFAADRATRMHEARRIAHMLRDLNLMPKPLIARVNGTAMGGGLGLMSVADVAVAVTGARFGFSEVRLGLIPATISPYVLARMGEGPARRVFMSGRVFCAEELPALGLAARVVAPDALDAAVEAEIAPCLVAAPGAVATAKRLARRLGPVIDDALIEETVALLADCWEGEEAQEGIAAFLEKRRPRWG